MAFYGLLVEGFVFLREHQMLLFPINLNIDPDIEIVISVLSSSFLIPVLCIALLLVGSFRIFKSRFIIFFLCWFFIILSPSSSIVTLHDLAARYNVSAERIRQLEQNAMKKLRVAMAA